MRFGQVSAIGGGRKGSGRIGRHRQGLDNRRLPDRKKKCGGVGSFIDGSPFDRTTIARGGFC